NAEPRKSLPPDFGTMLMLGPPVSASARPPEISTCISSAFAVSYVTSETPPPPKGAATVRPLVMTRPSPLAPPCVLKNVIEGVVGAVVALAPATPPVLSAVAARRGQRAQHFVVQDHFSPHRLGVDQGRLSCHGDGFFNGADPELDVH